MGKQKCIGDMLYIIASHSNTAFDIGSHYFSETILMVNENHSVQLPSFDYCTY